jgi:hypothetical protein
MPAIADLMDSRSMERRCHSGLPTGVASNLALMAANSVSLDELSLPFKAKRTESFDRSPF